MIDFEQIEFIKNNSIKNTLGVLLYQKLKVLTDEINTITFKTMDDEKIKKSQNVIEELKIEIDILYTEFKKILFTNGGKRI